MFELPTAINPNTNTKSVYFAFKDGDNWLFISLKQLLEFAFGYKNKFYIQLHYFESDVKNRSDFDNFINK